MNRFGPFARVPLLDRAVVLHAGIAANPGSFRNFVQQRGGVFLFQRFAAGDSARPPFFARKRGVHEFIRSAHGKIFVLIHHAAVSIAVVGAVVALLDQRPGLLLFALFAIDEFFNVAVPIFQRVHLGRATSLATGFHDVGDLVVNFQERQRTTRTAAAAQFFFAGTDR